MKYFATNIELTIGIEFHVFMSNKLIFSESENYNVFAVYQIFCVCVILVED